MPILTLPLLVGYDSNNCLYSPGQDPGGSGPPMGRRGNHMSVTPVVLGWILWIYPRGDPPIIALTVYTTLLAIVTVQVGLLQAGNTRSTQ